LRTDVKWKFLFLYVMLDEWSRKKVGWLIAETESAAHGKELTDRALEEEGLLLADKSALPTVHNDRGSPMKARSFKRFLEDLGLSQVFSRPRTPNDNPFVEAFFRTAKYAPSYPGYFRSQQEAIEYFTTFFRWYNEEYLHSGIQYVPPALKHAGVADQIVKVRQERLAEARSRRLQMNCGASETGVTGVPSMDSGL
jgi:transposase InsO family protein